MRIVEYHHSPTAKYVIEGVRVNGRRKRLFFQTEAKAEKELARLKIKQRKEGQNALSVSDSLRIMALDCAGDLQPFGKTIRDATDFYLKYLREALRSVTVGALVDEYGIDYYANTYHSGARIDAYAAMLTKATDGIRAAGGFGEAAGA